MTANFCTCYRRSCIGRLVLSRTVLLLRLFLNYVNIVLEVGSLLWLLRILSILLILISLLLLWPSETYWRRLYCCSCWHQGWCWYCDINVVIIEVAIGNLPYLLRTMSIVLLMLLLPLFCKFSTYRACRGRRFRQHLSRKDCRWRSSGEEEWSPSSRDRRQPVHGPR